MARCINKLSARAAATFSRPGRHSDGGNLFLAIDKTGRRRWTFLWRRGGTTHEIGLGSASAVSLARARELASEYRDGLAKGVSPLERREAEQRARDGKKTFGACADALLDAKSSEWRNAKHRAQWKMTLEEYAKPLRALPVDGVTTEAVLSVLQPIWQSIPETASRLRGRIEAVLDFAKAHGWRAGENPAAWRGHLALILPRRSKLARGHYAAMPFDDVPAFIGKLREREATAALALEFAILTAARSGEVLGARWAEIDVEEKVWTIPASRMKGGREHRVPLSTKVLAILERLCVVRSGPFVFPGQRHGNLLSPRALEMVLHRMKIEGVTVHGFRSAFRDWCGETTSFPRELAEAALAHVSGDATERAYRRGDALEKRRKLMEAWAGFCEPKAGSNVLSMTRQNASR
ncbi:MAG TPA: tyrosine-type recombinase/integrase [Methylocella sp.]|nr:tyrosine-type recombinase/integrase [Methylocella sp.]